MPDESASKSSVRSVRVVLPWLLAAGMGAVYAFTLNRWVSSEGLGLVANVSGLNWRVELFRPVTYLVTYPFRWLPGPWIPLALNLFAAGCAVVSLAWLARSVALLPHDLTEGQRQRIQGEPPFLAVRGAWLPPALAVLACGLQLTFWEHATGATGEMVDLLLFAWLVRNLVELRVDGDTARLPRCAFVYGLAVANNWAMVAFGPLFFLGAARAVRANPFTELFLEQVLAGFNDRGQPLTKRLGLALRPFNPRLWAGIVGGVLGGLLLLLLLPLVASWSEEAPTDFWPALHVTLRTYKQLLLAVPMRTVVLLCLTSVLPAVFMTIRWQGQVGGVGALAHFLDGTFNFIHGLLLAGCLLAALDFPLSPRGLGMAFPCLPLYYLAALSAGYFGGYLLLVCGTRPPDDVRWRGPVVRFIDGGLTACVWLSLVAVPAVLAWKNLPRVLWDRHGAVATYAAQLERSLPAAGAVLLSDGSFGALCVEAALVHEGQQAGYVAMDMTLLGEEGYFQFVQRQHPEMRLTLPAFRMASDLTNAAVLVAWVKELAEAREVYCLNPVLGPLAESFSVQPRGLLYQLKPAAASARETEPLPAAALEENRAFWRAFSAGPLAELVRHAAPAEPLARRGRWQWLGRVVPLKPEPDRWAVIVGSLCSGAMDAWGVELQKAGQLAEAGECFALALRSNGENAAARINRDFNLDLQARRPAVIQSAQEVEAWLGKRRSWARILAVDGPLDEPNVCYRLGTLFAEARLPREAIQEFGRVQALAPGYADATLRLAEQLLLAGEYTNALAEAQRALAREPRSPAGLFLKGYSLLELTNLAGAVETLTQAVTLETTNSRARLARASAYLQLGELEAARQDYHEAARWLTNSYPAYFGLAEIAYRQKDIPAAVKYGRLYLSNTPPEFVGARIIRGHLTELETEGVKR